jgi:hypothetical protein
MTILCNIFLFGKITSKKTLIVHGGYFYSLWLFWKYVKLIINCFHVTCSFHILMRFLTTIYNFLYVLFLHTTLSPLQIISL